MSLSVIEKRENLKNEAEKYITEYLKCKKDFNYFCSNYIYLELGGGDVLFNPYDKQIDLIDCINKNKHVIITKSRQIGISTIVQAYCAWLVCFYKNVVVGVISKDGPESTDFARTIRGMIEKIPSWFGASFVKNTERSFILSNGSKLYTSPVAPTAPDKTLRGKAITFLIIDEAAFIKYLDDAWTAIVPALSTNQTNARKVGIPYGTVILSTPNKTVGVGKWYYSKWTSARNGDSIFTPFVIHWSEIKELADDPDWYNTQCQMLDNDQKKIQQELELKFVSTEGTFFPEETIQKLQENKVEPRQKIKAKNGWIWKFNDPIPGKHYLIGVDTATEHGTDKSTVEVIDYETMEQVWEFQGKCKVHEFCEVVKLSADIFQNATIIVERNSVGNQVVEYIESTEHVGKVYKGKKSGNSDKKSNGLSTNSATRPLMVDALYSYVCQYPECIKSERLILELIGLIEKPSGRVEADIGIHDDLCLALSFCHFVRKYDPPLMVNIDKNYENSFMDIVGMNVGNRPSGHQPIDNNQIMKEVKENRDDYTDIFSLFNYSNG